MKITDAHLKTIYAHAKETYPRECFGFILGHFDDGGQARQIISGTNLNTERDDRFEMDPHDFIRVERDAEDAELEIIGFYHSHPNWPPIPSQTDIDFAWEGMFYLIVSLHKGRPFNTNIWQLTEDKPRRFEQTALVIVDENALDGDQQE
ncbi:MAG TPA: M67 family metallopeptidase [Chloroflexi bacterium]|nr:M67 family metallopeptidase [Chloroflexota bacterium]